MTPKTESNFGIKTRDRGRKIARLSFISLLAVVFCFLSVTPVHAAWYNSNWQYRKKLTIDYTKVGATLSHFAVLVSLTSDSDLAARARSDGYDILFTSSDGTTKLDHEIEKYTSTTGELVAWVRIPSLSGSVDTDIYMYYGYASATDQQNATGVWNDNGGTATNYKGVWHLKETSSTTIADSASSANTGTASGFTGGPAYYFQSKSQAYGGTSPVTITFDRPSVSGNLIVVSFNFGNQARTVSSVTDSKGNTYNLAIGPTDWSGGTYRAYTYYASNITGGGTAITITITLSGAPTSLFEIYASEYTGIATVSPLDQTSSATGTGTAINSGSRTTTQADELIYGYAEENSGFTTTPTAPLVQRENMNLNFTADQTVTSTGSYSVAGTISSSAGWFCHMVTFKAARTTGKIDGGVGLDGSNDYIYTTNSAANPQNFTYEGWFKTTSATGHPIIGFESSRTGEGSASWDRHVYIGTDGKLYFEVGATGTPVAVSTSTYTDGAWHHFGAVHNSSDNYFYLYVDGALVGSNTSGSAGENSTGYWRIGAYKVEWETQAVDGYFRGSVDEVRISTTNRSAGWIQTEYNNQNSPSTFYTIGGEQNLTAFEYNKLITIDYTRVSCSSGVTNFPVLISLSGVTDIKTTGNGGHVRNSNGYDIVFRDTNNVLLDHEVETYDGSAGTLVAWVRVPVISGTTNTILTMYYGNSTITTPTQNPAGVWDSNYKGVWHLKEASGNFADSTANGNTGTDNVSATGKTGNIGSGQQFDGTDDYISAPYMLNPSSTNFTWSGWVNFTNLPTTKGAAEVFASQLDGTGTGRTWARGKGTDNLLDGAWGGSTYNFSATGTWYYVCAAKTSSSTYAWYVNGANYGTSTSVTFDSATGDHRFGVSKDGLSPVDGYMDEVRISNTARSACYIQTEYNNMKWPNKAQSGVTGFITFGTESGGDVTLANHVAGQEADKFTSGTSVTGAELFAFKLTNNIASGVTVDQIQFQLSGVSGFGQSDFANLAIYLDANNDGAIGGGETTAVGGTGVVSSGVTTITFTTDFNISSGATVNYILKGDVSNLVAGDTVTIALGISNITLTSGTVGGTAATNVTHTADAAANLTQIHYRWRNDDGGEGLDTGSGADGSATISALRNINTNVIGSNRSTNADGILTTVTANPTGTSITVASTTGFAAGDEIFLINMQVTSGVTVDVGNYEFLRVASVPNGTTLNLTSSVQKSYDGASFANQKVVVQRVPQWTNVTIQSGGTLTANDWNGTSGGIVVFRATGTVDIQSGATITATGLGYRGGVGGIAGGITDVLGAGQNGESYDGYVGRGGDDNASGTGGGNPGTSGGGGSSNYNTSISPAGSRGGGGGGGNCDGNSDLDGAGGAGGGGYGGGGGGGGGGGDENNVGGAGGTGAPTTGVGGGGGGNAVDVAAGGAGGAAGNAGSGLDPVAAAGSGASTGQGGRSQNGTANGIGAGGGGGGGFYGAAALTQLFLGSGGGGGGGKDSNGGFGVAGAAGGDAGGIIYFIANTVTVSGSVTSNGSNGGAASGDGGGSGGGSGGSILIQANYATLGSGLVTATGGAGGAVAASGGGGGQGGVGLIRIECDSINGTTTPGASTAGTPSGTSASWAADQDTKLNEAIPGKIYRLRFEVSNEGTATSGAVTYKLQVAQTDTCGSGTYADVPVVPSSSDHWQIVNSAYLTDTAATTDVVSGLTNEATTFVPGQVKDTGNTTGSITLNTNQFTELEFAVQATDYALLGANYCFKLVTASGTSVSTYSVYGEIGTSACQYLYRKPLTIDYTKRGSSCGTSGVTEFPVLISMSGVTDIKTTAYGGHVQSSSGYDIIFRASNGVDELWHEVESYNGTTGTLVAWVRVPVISGTADTTIYMYYGNQCITSAPPSTFATQVWDSTYKGVWHLKEGTGVTAADSTSNANSAVPDSGNPTASTGQIGGALTFASPSRLVIAASASLDLTSATTPYWTMSAWVRPTSYTGTSWPVIYSDGSFRASMGLSQATAGTDGRIENWTNDTTVLDSTTAVTLNAWNYVTVTRTATTTSFYLNGSANGSGASTAVTLGNVVSGIGADANGTIEAVEQFLGLIDEVRVSASNTSSGARSACWIGTEYNNQNWPNKTESGTTGFVTIGAEQGAAAPTAVSLLSFKATGDGGDVVVSWTTAQEIKNFGFHVYRSESVGGPYTRITDTLIPGLTFSVRGRDYSYVDRNVTRGRLYYYKLEDIDMDGTRSMHGPVCVDWDGDGIPDDWEQRYGLNPGVDDSGLDADGDGLTNLQEYGRGTDPLRVDTDGDGVRDSQEEYAGSVTPGLMRGVEVIASDATGMTLELRTESFESVVLDEGGVSYRRLRVPEYVHGYTEVVGKPELPVKGILIDLPSGKGGSLSIESAESRELSNYWIYPVPEKVVSGEGELATVSEVFTIDDAAYRLNSFYPDVVARVGETYDYRGQKKLQVFFNPFSFNPVTRELVQYTRIRVRVAYVALAEEVPVVRSGVPLTAPVSGLARSMVWVPPAPAAAYKMLVSEEGIYRLTGAWLASQGVSVSDWSQVRVYSLSQEIPIYQGADYIEFYGTPPSEDYGKYTKSNVYWLTTSGGSGSPLRMGTINGAPGAGTIPGTHVFTVHMEEDQEYLGEAPGAESLDRWVHGTFALGSGAGGGPTDYAVTLPGVGGTQLGQVTVLLCGLTTLAHDVEIAFNGVSLGTYQWSGFEFYEVSFNDVALVDGLNTLTLTCLSGADPVNPDGVALDWVEVAYPRKYEANGNLLKLTHNAGYKYQIGNFTSNSIQAYDITTPTDVKRITNIQVTGTNPYTLTMEPGSGSGERTYLTLSSAATKTPVSITKDTAGNLSGTSNGADYILITHRDLGWDGGGSARPWLTNLKAQREAQGLRVKVVDVEDIYDEFSYGIMSPQGIKDFLSYTYQNWVSPAPQYVLLVGDSAYDPKDNYGLGTINYVPAYLAQTPFMGENLIDEWYVRISGNDALADMDIGRLPASTTAQAETMVNKILAYENAPVLKTWERNTVLVADNQVEGYEVLFELMNEDVAALLPTGMNAPFREYLNDYGSAGDLTNSLKNKLNVDGALIVNYSGHGSVQVWAGERIFEHVLPAQPGYRQDVNDLTNAGKLPFVVAMTCLNGSFGYPEGWGFPSLAEVLLRDSANGAVAALMSTGMTEPEGQRVLDRALFEGIFKRDLRTLGRAISYAKQELVANSAALGETGKTFLLFGDPAMRLKVPLPTAPTSPTGQVSGQSVTLTWGASSDANGRAVAGYNVYRSTTPNGSYTKLNSSLITNNGYTDNSIQSGTYYYVVKSVDVDGYESPGTLEMSVTIGARSAGGSGGGGGGGGCFVSSML